MVKQNEALLQTKATTIHSLYDAYAGMLMGYIFEIVKDKTLAEEYLVKAFSSVNKQFNEINWSDNKWCLLQRIAKNELTEFYKALKDCDPPVTAINTNSPNKYHDRMTDEQKHIFCNFYYNKRTSAELSQELNKPEKLIRAQLKEAFAVIKTSHDN
ncbi:MAG TPA: hypothetical protein VL490_11915 [Mucilaginibacter sp.]|jgi:hypothetical protein|nr:hypothetical protein [Mucilaginibacter sp.]